MFKLNISKIVRPLKAALSVNGLNIISYPYCENGIQQDVWEKPGVSHEAVRPRAILLTECRHQLYTTLTTRITNLSVQYNKEIDQ